MQLISSKTLKNVQLIKIKSFSFAARFSHFKTSSNTLFQGILQGFSALFQGSLYNLDQLDEENKDILE